MVDARGAEPIQPPDYIPAPGHFVKINLAPATGHEESGLRRALVLSPKIYNEKTGLAVVVPTTNQTKGYPFEVAIPAGLKVTGVILVDAIKSLDWQVRKVGFVESAPAEVVKAVQGKLMVLLGFPKA